MSGPEDTGAHTAVEILRAARAPGCLTERMDRYAQRFDGIGKQPHGDTIRRWASEVAELEVIRDLAIEAWSKMGDGGYFPTIGAPLSDKIRNALAKHSSAIKPIDRALASQGEAK